MLYGKCNETSYYSGEGVDQRKIVLHNNFNDRTFTEKGCRDGTS